MEREGGDVADGATSGRPEEAREVRRDVKQYLRPNTTVLGNSLHVNTAQMQVVSRCQPTTSD
eukprot:4765373-Pleurochrysis_carterae.AAC.2